MLDFAKLNDPQERARIDREIEERAQKEQEARERIRARIGEVLLKEGVRGANGQELVTVDELRFVRSLDRQIAVRWVDPSARQLAWLDKIYDRLNTPVDIDTRGIVQAQSVAQPTVVERTQVVTQRRVVPRPRGKS